VVCTVSGIKKCLSAGVNVPAVVKYEVTDFNTHIGATGLARANDSVTFLG